METENQEVISFFRLLIDETRLKIVGIAAQQPTCIEQMAALLKIRPSLVSHHVNMLMEAGLLQPHVAHGSTVYKLRTDTLYALAKRHLAVAAPSVTLELDGDDYERKVLADFMGRDGRLKDIPAQQKKRDVILRYLLHQFQPGARYSEKEVNATIKRFHDDTASLRRAMVDNGWLKRESGVYWRVE